MMLDADGQVQKAVTHFRDHVFVAAAAYQGHRNVNVRRVNGFDRQFVTVAARDLDYISLHDSRALYRDESLDWFRERGGDEDAGGVACGILLLIRDQQQVIVLRVPGHEFRPGDPY